ncbi:MAG TPA: PadR family transcriptional regulator [Candidatus Limosilactobacillus merdipullorum]|uniref:PadR family transcriptional regulator n=1 Tax=Candidatus Limosilactobacillus merdipullorum TaxID=2838653 RepID=A0A9D1QRA9_9LACO|nr:PadR family transcriptional regulator [Candidatus Limosilactobacillus merdipullorum]
MKIQTSADLLDGIVLAIVECHDYYGYALTQRVQQVIDISESTMYPVLRRLKKDGYLTTYDHPYHGRNRRYYRLTPQGQKHLNQIRQLWQQYETSLDHVFNDYQGGDEDRG